MNMIKSKLAMKNSGLSAEAVELKKKSNTKKLKPDPDPEDLKGFG